jgi:serine/threonine protein kinase
MGCSHSTKNICNRKGKTNMVSPLDKINIGDVLGKGQFGEVYEITCIENINKSCKMNNHYAMKICKKKKKLNFYIYNERTCLLKIKNDNIIRCHHTFLLKDNIYFILDLYKFDMYKYLDQYHDNTEVNTKIIIKNILKPLIFLRNKFYVHLDVKPENFLVRNIDEKDFVLTDLGTVHKIPRTNKNGIKHQYNNIYKQKVICGTEHYASPESFNGFFSEKSDIWSIGQITFILLTNHMIKNEPTMDDFDISNNLNNFPLEKGSHKFIKKCMRVDISQRMSYKKILSHPWLHE